MPSVRTVVSDIYHRNVNGFGIAPANEPIGITLSDREHIEEMSDPTILGFGAGVVPRLTFAPVGPGVVANAKVLHYKDHWSTTATANRDCRIVVSRDYRGCLYSVYYTGKGNFVCVHTSRPLSAPTDRADIRVGVDHYVVLLLRYALDRDWKLVHQVPTAGVAAQQGLQGINGFGFVTRIHSNINPVEVRTVRVAYDAQSLFLARDRFYTRWPHM